MNHFGLVVELSKIAVEHYSQADSKQQVKRLDFELVTFRHLFNKVASTHYTPADPSTDRQQMNNFIFLKERFHSKLITPETSFHAFPASFRKHS